ncbi:MAG: insulinase family protein [Oscillospiraceae bacterium]|nr:insulinase family protein [Oscillospiraceae bacterium]
MAKSTRKEIHPFVFLTHHQTPKFKTATLRLAFLTQLDREHAAKNALLPRVLLRGTERYPDMAALAMALDDLYGATLVPKVAKKGEIQCVGLTASFVDDACLPEEAEILAQMAALLGEVLLRPVREGGQLNAEYVDGEREQLLDEIRGRINNKRTYALTRLTELMCDGEAFSVFRLGTEEEAEGIDAEGLTAHYEALLGAAPVEIFYSGTASIEQVERVLKKALTDLPRTEPDFDMGTDVRMNSLAEEPRYFEEEMDVTQGKLSLGFRLGACMEVPDYAAIQLFHYIYGGSVNSKLFLHVRERLSLCYYASSVLEKAKGLLLVASGIEFSKFDEAKGEILAQLNAMCEGDISDEELTWGKKALMTDLRILKDEPSQLEDFYLQQTILGEDDGIDELIAKVEQVDKARLVEIANGLQLDAIYFLTGEENA